MADIDFEVDDREIRSLDDDMREPWPEEGVHCDVPGCSVFNNSKQSIQKNWKISILTVLRSTTIASLFLHIVGLVTPTYSEALYLIK
jgi:hypothetical protein